MQEGKKVKVLVTIRRLECGFAGLKYPTSLASFGARKSS